MASVTLAQFVKISTEPEETKSRLNLLPFVVFNKFVAKHLTDVDKLCVQLATSRDQRFISEKELDECKEEDKWYDDNDQEYEDDFVAQWNDEYFNENERDKW